MFCIGSINEKEYTCLNKFRLYNVYRKYIWDISEKYYNIKYCTITKKNSLYQINFNVFLKSEKMNNKQLKQQFCPQIKIFVLIINRF